MEAVARAGRCASSVLGGYGFEGPGGNLAGGVFHVDVDVDVWIGPFHFADGAELG